MKKTKSIKEITTTADVSGYESPKFVGKTERAKKSALSDKWAPMQKTYKHTKKR